MIKLIFTSKHIIENIVLAERNVSVIMGFLIIDNGNQTDILCFLNSSQHLCQNLLSVAGILNLKMASVGDSSIYLAKVKTEKYKQYQYHYNTQDIRDDCKIAPMSIPCRFILKCGCV